MSKNQKEVQVVSAGKSLSINSPSQMKALAVTTKAYVIENKLYSPIAGKNYVHVEGWQFAGGMIGILPRVVEVKDISQDGVIAWTAQVELVNLKDGSIVGRGFAMCSNKEGKKKSFDEYAIVSMAQTRAIGKAYRNTIGWVMKLAGYEGTPAEEMQKAGEELPTIQHDAGKVDPKNVTLKEGQIIGPGGKATWACDVCGDPISDAGATYSQRVYGKRLCKEHASEAKPLKRK